MIKKTNLLLTGTGIGTMILFIILIGVVFVWLLSGYGVKVSCESNEILGLSTIPPPMMTVVAETSCFVNYSIKVSDQKICSGMNKITDKIGYLRCKEIKDYPDKSIYVDVLFYDNNKKLVGTDNKNFVYKS